MSRTRSALVVTALAALAVPAAAAPSAGLGSLGPWAGALEPGEAHHHVYENNPEVVFVCPAVLRPYAAALAYQPPTAEVTLQVGGGQVPVDAGHATHDFQASHCAEVDLQVEAGHDGPTVAYQLDVEPLRP